jgi:hypothetical protein
LSKKVVDLFPSKEGVRDDGRQLRIAVDPMDILHALAYEARVVFAAANILGRGKALHPDDLDRLRLAVRRFDTALRWYC